MLDGVVVLEGVADSVTVFDGDTLRVFVEVGVSVIEGVNVPDGDIVTDGVPVPVLDGLLDGVPDIL